MYHVSEHDEFLLSQLLDGDLPLDEAVTLRKRLDSEPQLRRVLDELARVDGLVKARRSNLPTVNYEGFHVQLMNRIAAETVEVSEADEFLLSQLLDGGLSSQEEARIKERLALEPALQARYGSLSCVNNALLEQRAAMPAVDYSRFHKQLMGEVRREEAAKERRTLRFPMWARFAAPLVAAAAIAMVVWLQPGQRPTAQPGMIQPSGAEIAQVDQTGGDQPAPEALAMAGSDESVTIVRTNAPVPVESGTIMVQVVGKPVNGDSDDGIHVSFARSNDIAESVEEGDRERSSRPAKKVIFVAANPSPPTQAVAGDLF